MENKDLMETSLKKSKMIDALETSFGNVTQAANLVGITPRTHYLWLKQDREYAQQSENIRDISFRKIRDKILENALKKMDNGDTSVLNRMMAIYFKNLPAEMLRASMCNNVPLVAQIKYIKTREEADEIRRERGGM